MELMDLYRNRFSEEDRANKQRVWRVLWEEVFAKQVGDARVLLDLGAGYCEFINSATTPRRIAVDLNPDTAQLAAPGVEVVRTSAEDLSFLKDGEVDAVFSSNFFEHLPNKDVLGKVVRSVLRVLRPGGVFLAMGPNIRLLPSVYWDYFDHHIPLSDRSLCELLVTTGFNLDQVEPRFMPYTVNSALPKWPWLVRAYLRLRPLSTRLFGKQFLITASKPTSPERSR